MPGVGKCCRDCRPKREGAFVNRQRLVVVVGKKIQRLSPTLLISFPKAKQSRWSMVPYSVGSTQQERIFSAGKVVHDERKFVERDTVQGDSFNLEAVFY